MSESDGEQAARSLALEQAYVHEVYEQCADRTVQGRQWPRIYQFLEELEPGALVCDIGCGNGKYLNVNHNVFKVGVDRCQRFTNIARDKQNEVLTCDNLSLPFRDESFDAVLSIAVVHHFSTTERRVRAIKELARVLRIGGRLIISVWAMEQKHRKFESQDVLVPWPKAYGISSTGSPMRVRGMSCDERHRGKNAQTYLMSKRGSNSQRKGSNNSSSNGSNVGNGGGGGGGVGGGSSGNKATANKGYWIDPIFSPSPSTSSLSSPNETCYSFIRRALQKLAGGRRNSRAWFLENWQSNGKERHSYDEDEDDDDDDDGDVDDLPIELRRLEEHHSGLDKNPSSVGGRGGNGGGGNAAEDEDPGKRAQLKQQHSDSLSVKSKSLSSIVDVQRADLVHSRSSIPGLCAGAAAAAAVAASTASSVEEQAIQQQQQLEVPNAPVLATKPRLVKQKTHLLEDTCLEDEDGNHDHDPDYTAIPDIFKDVPVIFNQVLSGSKQRNVHKQSSLNEELMSIERLRERESVRKNIMKQASLNEELIYKTSTPSAGTSFEAFKDSFYSVSATKRFQLLKSGLTSRIRQSTTSIEKVSGISIKNGFVRILQSWKSTESPASATTPTTTTTTTTTTSTTSRFDDPNGAGQQQQQQQHHSSRYSQSSTNSSSSGGGGSSSKREVELAGISIERRLSREDGSDSSKDSSLQSDTSVDSEDSLPSVIYNPRKSSSPQIEAVIGPGPPAGLQLSTASAPPSPRLKYAPEVAGQRLKLVSMSPLLKQQFPATSKSLPPPSPPGLSPHTLKIANMRPFFSGNEVLVAPPPPPSFSERLAEVKRSFDAQQPLPSIPKPSGLGPGDESLLRTSLPSPPAAAAAAAAVTAATAADDAQGAAKGPAAEAVTKKLSEEQRRREPPPPVQRPSLQTIRGYRSMSVTVNEDDEPSSDDTSPLIADAIDEALERLSEKPLIVPGSLSSVASAATSTTITKRNKIINEEEEEEEEEGAEGEGENSRKSRLNQIKELLSQKPGFATRAKTAFPIVRRASTSSSGRFETVTKVLPRLLSLELFNPETDDLDSDSSGVSSPESVGSVISVISDERYVSKQEPADAGSDKTASEQEPASRPPPAPLSRTNPFIVDDDPNPALDALSTSSPTEKSPSVVVSSKSASSGETKSTRPISLDTRMSPVESTWNEECNRQLNDLTDRLSGGNLIKDIDQYCRRTKLDLDNDDPHNLAYPRGRTCKYDSGLKQQETTTAANRQSRESNDSFCDPDNNNKVVVVVADDGVVVADGNKTSQLAIQRSCSEESDAGSSHSGFIVVTKNGEFLSEHELRQQQQQQQQQKQQQQQQTIKAPKIGQQRYTNGNNSIESSDIGDSIENTISESSSQAETRRLCSSSSASLASSSLASTEPQARLRLSAQPRSASEEIPSTRSSASSTAFLLQRHTLGGPGGGGGGPGSPYRRHQQPPRRSATSISNGTLSGSSSQESLPSDQMTYHQYYHVFREGELDQLIDKYVENLHIISSYYDQSSWCIVAEKVQVWTI